MKVKLFKYSRADGWTPELSPEMDTEQTLVLVFGSPTLTSDTTAFSDLSQAYPTSKISGCSTAGEIFGTEILDDTLSVAVLQFEHTNLKSTHVKIQDASESFSAGQEIANALNKPDLKGVLIVSDGLAVNGSELVRGMNEILPESVVVTGGLAGDGSRFESTWVLKDSVPESGYISAVAYYGDSVKITHGSKGGWDKFGPKRLVTKSTENVLYELDGKPALALYKEYLGERASGLPATALLFPLALHADSEDSEFLVRTILSVNEEDQSMTFAGDLPEGQLVQLMRANFDRLIDGASDAASMANSGDDHSGDILNIAISCVGRRLVLGERCEEEVEATMDILPPGTLQIGFYSYGEISPHVNGQPCQLHNQTMTLTTLAETA